MHRHLEAFRPLRTPFPFSTQIKRKQHPIIQSSSPSSVGLIAKSAAESVATTPPSLAKKYDLIVIGGGSAGLTAAKFASTFKKSVCLIESSRIGGDCTWTGCIPSKTLLAAAKRVHTWRKMNEKYSPTVLVDENNVALYNILRDVKLAIDINRQRIYDEDDSPQVLAALGVHVVHGRARFCDAKTVNVIPNESNDDGVSNAYQLRAKFGIIIATGATPSNTIVEDIAGLDTVPFWTYENIWDEFFLTIENMNRKKEIWKQKKVIVVGGGPIGCEMSQAISRLGCSVVLIAKTPRLLPDADVDASVELQKALEDEQIDVICNQSVVSVTTENLSKKDSNEFGIRVYLSSQESILGDHILVATGRTPNINNLGLDDIGVQIKDDTIGGILVDHQLRTSVKGIFAAGDCTGDRQFTHYAGFQGAIAARNIILPLKDKGVLSNVPSTTFTDPEVASVGLTEQSALDEYGEDEVSTSRRPLAKIDRAICEGVEAHGFIKIVYKTRSKQIVGASIVGPSAGELISEIAVAMDAKLSLDQLATVMHSYPSYSIALQQMAAEVYYDKLKKNTGMYELLKKFGL